MTHLVFFDVLTGELEKILDSVKTMIAKIIDSAQSSIHSVNLDESLFLSINVYGIHVLVIITLLVLQNLIRQGKGGSTALPAPALIDRS